MSNYVEPLVYRPARWSLATTVAPVIEPVSIIDAREHFRGELAAELDSTIARMLAAARGAVEKATRRAMLTQTRVLRLDRFPVAAHQVIELPGGVIQSVSSVSYTDADNATQTLASSVYATDFATDSGTGRLALAADQDWPETGDEGLAVTITYVAGWASAALVPAQLRTATLLMLAWLYDHRSAFEASAPSENPAYAAMIAPWRIGRIG